MNEKRIHHDPTYSNSPAVKAAIEYEDRAAFVRSVIEATTECRFGCDRASRFVIDDINPQIDPPIFWDISFDVPQPHYIHSPLGRQRKERGEIGVSDTTKQESIRLGSMPHNETSPVFASPNQGRGST